MKKNAGTRGCKYGQRTNREGHGGVAFSMESPKVLSRVLPRPGLYFRKCSYSNWEAGREESTTSCLEGVEESMQQS